MADPGEGATTAGTPARRGPETILGVAPWTALGGLLLLAAAVTLYLGRNLTFLSDELIWLATSDGYSPETILTPHNGHLIALPRLLYETLPQIFGDSYLPFRLISVAALCGAGAAFFAFARPRVPAAMALGLTALLLFMGSAEVVAVSALGLPFLLAIAFGLAAVAAADAERDGLAVAAVILAVASHTLGVVFGAGLLVHALLARRPLRVSLTYLAPLALYAIWWIWASKFDQGIAEASNLSGIPQYAAESASVALGALSGVTPLLANPIASMQSALPAAAIPVVIVLALLAIWLWRRKAYGPWAFAFVVMLTLFWFSTGLAESDTRLPTTPRFAAVAAVVILLLAVALLSRLDLGSRAWTGLGVLVGLAIAGNVVGLVRGVDELDGWADQTRVQLAAMALAGDDAAAGFRPISATQGGGRVPISVAEAATLEGEIGGVDDIRSAPEELRDEADLVLIRAGGLLAVPVEDESAAGDVCDRGTDLELEPGEYVLSGAEPSSIGVRRFASSQLVPVGTIQPDAPAQIALPEDQASEPWILSGSTDVTACGVGSGQG